MKTTIIIVSEKPFVILPLADYEGMKETIEILSENPNIVDEPRKGENEFLKGNYVFYAKKSNKVKKNDLRIKRTR